MRADRGRVALRGVRDQRHAAGAFFVDAGSLLPVVLPAGAGAAGTGAIAPELGLYPWRIAAGDRDDDAGDGDSIAGLHRTGGGGDFQRALLRDPRKQLGRIAGAAHPDLDDRPGRSSDQAILRGPAARRVHSLGGVGRAAFVVAALHRGLIPGADLWHGDYAAAVDGPRTAALPPGAGAAGDDRRRRADGTLQTLFAQSGDVGGFRGAGGTQLDQRPQPLLRVRHACRYRSAAEPGAGCADLADPSQLPDDGPGLFYQHRDFVQSVVSILAGQDAGICLLGAGHLLLRKDRCLQPCGADDGDAEPPEHGGDGGAGGAGSVDGTGPFARGLASG